MDADVDVGVVGGGPAGLAAAWTLATGGARVTIYERADEFGGRMATDRWTHPDGEVRVDAGVQLLASYFRETLRITDEANARDRLVRTRGRDALWRRGRPNPIDYGSLASMATTAALPTRLKLRLAGRYTRYLARHAGELDAAVPARAAEAGLDRESIADWGRRELGRDFVELMGYPLLGSLYGATPEQVSAGFYHGLARAGMDVRLYAVRGGVAELPLAWARALTDRGVRLRPRTAVRRVADDRAADGAAHGAAAGATADGEDDGAAVRIRLDDASVRHDAAILAVPAAEAARVLAGPAPPLRDWLAGVRTAPALSLALLVEPPVRGDYFGLSFPRTRPPGDRIVACCIEENKLGELVPAGAGLLVVLPAPAFTPRLVDADVDAALALLVPSLERAFPGLGRRIRRAEVYRFPAGHTLFHPGYAARLNRFDPAWPGRRIALAGDYLVAPTVEGAVRSGVVAAERVLGTVAEASAESG